MNILGIVMQNLKKEYAKKYLISMILNFLILFLKLEEQYLAINVMRLKEHLKILIQIN